MYPPILIKYPTRYFVIQCTHLTTTIFKSTSMFIILIFIFLIDLYTFQGIKTLTASFDSVSARNMTHWAFWIVNIVFLGIIAFGFLTFDRAKGIFADPEKIHYVKYEGSMVRTQGGLTTPRPPLAPSGP